MRNKAVDITKGIGIVLVIFAHLPWKFAGYGYLRGLIYNFHIPLFFCFAGYFITTSEFQEVFIKKIKSLLIPYIVLISFFYILPAIVYALYKNSFIDPAQLRDFLIAFVMSNGHYYKQAGITVVLWFLPCYFVYSLILQFIINLRAGAFVTGIVVFIIGLITNYSVAKYNFHGFMPWGIDVALIALPFGLIGSKFRTLDRIPYPALLLCVITLTGLTAFYRFDMQSFSINNYFVFILLGAIGAFLVYQVAQIIKNIGFSTLLAQLGERSLYLYGLHTFATMWVSFFTVYAFVQSQLLRLIMTLVLDLLVPLVIYYVIAKSKINVYANVTADSGLKSGDV